MLTFAAELGTFQGLTSAWLTCLYTHDHTGEEAAAFLAAWDGSRWRPSAFVLLTGLELDLTHVPPPAFDPADRGFTPVLCAVCTEAALLRAFGDYARAAAAYGEGAA